ncbi:transmembrane protein 207 isoform X2 [Elephas maximus indicus]|uniref:transmembrane protein 207 isoform X2 n=1 Tax=Elephas maximus indicus TaxID=99487 RepID=UPI0021166B27|nr:transmembrane protein 207 isoform X2 [Elephas maximus indicus]
MPAPRSFSFTSVILKAGILCLPLFQPVLSDLPCGEHEMFLLLIFLVLLLCGAVVFCLQCWLKRSQIVSPRQTIAVFAVGDLDTVYGMEAAVSPTIGIHLQTQNPELFPVSSFGALGPPPPYEEILKTSRL